MTTTTETTTTTTDKMRYKISDGQRPRYVTMTRGQRWWARREYRFMRRRNVDRWLANGVITRAMIWMDNDR